MSTILIIDDDVNALKLLGYTLRKAGFSILVAQNGFEGISKAEEHIPDLVVSDLMMPRMDGYEVTRRIRKHPKTKHIPVILLTAKSQVQDKVAGFEAGANDYVTKPVMPAELIARIKAQLGARSAVEPQVVKPRARLIGFLGSKGGIGLTTLLVNLGLLIQNSGKTVLLVDMKSSGGNISQMLGYAVSNNLLSILRNKLTPISSGDLGHAIITHSSGLTFLPPPHGVYARYQPIEPKQAKSILNTLDTTVDFVLIDLGTALTPTATSVLKICHQVCLATEPNLLAFDQMRRIVQYTADLKLNTSHIGTVVINRSRTGHSFNMAQIKSIVQTELWGIISPAPELAHQITQAKTTFVEFNPNHIVSQQYLQLLPLFHAT